MDLGFATLTHSRYPGGHRCPPHAHEFSKVSLLLSGELRERAGGCEVEPHAGSLVVKPAGVEHSDEITEDRYYYFLKSVPARGYGYSNVHFTLAGRVIAAVCGKDWRDVLAERIFAPLGMKQATGHADSMYARADVAIPMEGTSGHFTACATRKTDRTMHAAGGLGTSILDLERWLRFQLGSGEVDGTRLVSAKGLAEMHVTQAKGKPSGSVKVREGSGLGWFTSSYRGHRCIEHGGGYVGTAELISFLPEEQIGVAVVANATIGQALTQLVTRDVFDAVVEPTADDQLPDLRKKVQRFFARKRSASRPKNLAHSKLRKLEPAAYTGVFENEHFGTMRIAYTGGRLSGRLGQLPFDIVEHGDGIQVVSSAGTSPVRFERGKGDERVTRIEVEGLTTGVTTFTRRD